MQISFEPAIALLNVYLTDWPVRVWKHILRIFTVGLSIVAKAGNNLNV